jgi:hypothetical protein
VPFSPLQQRISELCSRAVGTADPTELRDLIPELQSALKEHLTQLSELVGEAKETIAVLPVIERRKRARPAVG